MSVFGDEMRKHRAQRQKERQELMAAAKAWNVPTAVSRFIREAESVSFMAPCAGYASELMIKAPAGSVYYIYVGLANVSGIMDESGIAIVEGKLELRAGDIIRCNVEGKDSEEVTAHVAFLFYNDISVNKRVEDPDA